MTTPTDATPGTIPSELAILALLLEVARDEQLCAPDSFWWNNQSKRGIYLTFRTYGEYRAWSKALRADRETSVHVHSGADSSHGFGAEVPDWNGYTVKLSCGVPDYKLTEVDPDTSDRIDDLVATLGGRTKACPDCAGLGYKESWSAGTNSRHACRCAARMVTK